MKHVMGFSGGIDSQAVGRYLINRYAAEDIIMLRSRAGQNEHPLTDAHAGWYSENIHPVIEVIPRVRMLWKTEGFAETKGMDGEQELTFDLLAKIKGKFPSRKSQFCTHFLKIIPAKDWVDRNLAGEEFRFYTGVRRDESEARKDTPWQEWNAFYDCELENPIFDWSKQMAFDFCLAHKEQVNQLYALGFHRVGCAPCINSGKDDIRVWHQRFPEMIDKIRGWEKSVGRTFFAPIVPGMKINWIDEVVAWAYTDRGGRQANLLKVIEERPSCESKFGLCE